ncbi:MAG TPA: hypothetical protein VGA77_06645 [Propylenella sp.]
MTINSYARGAVVRIEWTFLDQNGTVTDPDAVLLDVKRGDRTLVTYVYLGSPDLIVKDSTGVYHADVPLTVSGTWHYRAYATGEGAAAVHASFYVEPTPTDA